MIGQQLPGSELSLISGNYAHHLSSLLTYLVVVCVALTLALAFLTLR
jgi:hypothetical protein